MTDFLFRDNAYLKSCTATVVAIDAERGIALDQTVFYPLGGGQPGDVGKLTPENAAPIVIVDTRKGDGAEDIWHVPAPDAVLPKIGDKVIAKIDWDRRYRLMRMHSCLHLLSAVVPFSVTGGQISDGKGRLDFDVADTSGLDKDTITAKLNELVAAKYDLKSRWITDAELAASPELVKTMSVRPPVGQGRVRLVEVSGLDLQACGGTHVKNTIEIGPIIVRKIESKGKQNRRINIEFV